MATSKKDPRTCLNGHKYYKSSSCPVCPVCEKERGPSEDFLAAVASPARRALENAGISKLIQLTRFTEAELLELHGMGPGSIPKLRTALLSKGLTFRKK